MISNEQRVAIVGATGAVGSELLDLLIGRGCSNVMSIGRADLDGIDPRTAPVFDEYDVVFFCTPSDVSKKWVGAATSAGCIVIDNSSAFRMDENVPLVIPEVNGSIITRYSSVLANPNCSTILLLMILGPIDKALHVDRAIVSTYQAVSGAGREAMDELVDSTNAHLSGEDYSPNVFKQSCAFNVFSHDSAIAVQSGSNGEEEKIIQETRKILGRPIPLAATCIRVPVFRSHCESVTVEVARASSVEDLRTRLQSAVGVTVADDREGQRFPTAKLAAGRKSVFVGRIRADSSKAATGTNERGQLEYKSFSLFLSGDQLLKGAAWNALQIADIAVQKQAGYSIGKSAIRLVRS